MIEEPVAVTISDHRVRPSSQQLARLEGVPTGFVVDALDGNGACDYDINLLTPQAAVTHLCAPALTCDCRPGDMLGVWAALAELQAGDVMVVATGSWTGCAVIGDRVMGMAKNAGASGFVTDGLVRDAAGIRKVGLPVYCRGVSPNSPVSRGPCSVAMPVQIGTQHVRTGDIIVADSDGVVVLPFEKIDVVIDRIDTIKLLETQLDKQVTEGLVIPDAIAAILDSDQTRRI